MFNVCVNFPKYFERNNHIQNIPEKGTKKKIIFKNKNYLAFQP